LPAYCNPDALLPQIPDTRALFQRPPYLIQDFVGKAISFLRSHEMKGFGLDYDPSKVVPCRWKCSDESLFGVDLAIWAHTRAYPFDKGKIGAIFNPRALGAAVHHGSINVDIGGSHVGYLPGDDGGTFGRIWRPATGSYSTDCGYLSGLIAPYVRIYDDACDNILVHQPPGDRPRISVPNEYIQPSWSSGRVKLLVDLDTLTDGEVDYQQGQVHAHTQIGRSLFHLHDRFLERLDEASARACCSPQPTPIGRLLTHRYFNMWDEEANLRAGLPERRIKLYMKYIVAAQHTPAPLKAAVVNTAIEHNRLTDAVRADEYLGYDFVSFSGVFIDVYSAEVGSYVNLFLPVGMIIKPRGRSREREFSPEEIDHVLQAMPVAAPEIPLERVFDYQRPDAVLQQFTFAPGGSSG
jgi:hypothetical protein